MSRFVIHRHSGYGPVHWDLMLECGEALATWRIEADPLTASSGRPIEATRIAGHRKAYLDYEGPIAGGRGRVDVVDRGQLHILSSSKDLWELELDGEIFCGRFELLRGETGHEWTFLEVLIA